MTKQNSKFQPGRSGNPAGKPKGAIDKRSKWRDSLRDELPAIVERLVIAAKDGDTAAASLILSRCCPPLRPSREPIDVPGLKADSTATEIANALVAAAVRGELPSDAAAELVAALGAAAKLREVDDLAARIAKLEGDAP